MKTAEDISKALQEAEDVPDTQVLSEQASRYLQERSTAVVRETYMRAISSRFLRKMVNLELKYPELETFVPVYPRAEGVHVRAQDPLAVAKGLPASALGPALLELPQLKGGEYYSLLGIGVLSEYYRAGSRWIPDQHRGIAFIGLVYEGAIERPRVPVIGVQLSRLADLMFQLPMFLMRTAKELLYERDYYALRSNDQWGAQARHLTRRDIHTKGIPTALFLEHYMRLYRYLHSTVFPAWSFNHDFLTDHTPVRPNYRAACEKLFHRLNV